MIRIAVTGPESSGKTTLAEALASHFQVEVIPEYAREFLTKTKGKYSLESLNEIAEGQRKNIDKSQNSIKISDTDFVVLKIWADYKFNSTLPKVEASVDEQLFDLHILCTPDFPWEPDPLREHPYERDELFELYKQTLSDLNRNYIIVNGLREARLKKSIEAIESLLK